MDIDPKTFTNAFIRRSDPGNAPVDCDSFPCAAIPQTRVRSTDENPGLFDKSVRLAGRTEKKTPGGMPAGGLMIPGFFTRGRQA